MRRLVLQARLSDVRPMHRHRELELNIVRPVAPVILLGDRRYELGPTIWSGFFPRRTPTDRPFV